MTEQARALYEEEYSSFSYQDLYHEKGRLENEVEKQTEIWQKTNLGGSIALVIFGLVFLVVLIGIPLLVLGIRGIVVRSRDRNRANIAIWHARDRLEVIEGLIRKLRPNEETLKEGEEESK